MLGIISTIKLEERCTASYILTKSGKIPDSVMPIRASNIEIYQFVIILIWVENILTVSGGLYISLESAHFYFVL
ncbi:hypothetical protein DRF57_18490 [Chryseobacterium rhizosphaerae]|uniref:Uncharacterized protein n=1 Tax=Chryseobacterium rhizosphaerae TaxID=395937 RepID=A0ABX9IGS8_9FLAO|nr:hypothetical protein DRF57_18490 [Chryseobacterium rhizosphaerae]